MIKTTPLVFTFAIALSCSSTSADDAYSTAVTSTVLVRTDKTSNGAPLNFPTDSAGVAGIKVVIPAGAATGWHTHKHSGFAYILSGTLKVTLPDSSSHTYKAGEAFAEVVNTLHNGSAVGDKEVQLVAFFTVTGNQPVSIKP